MKPYYNQSPEEVRKTLHPDGTPLSAAQVAANQQKYGPNELTEGRKKTVFQIFLEQFQDFLVIILICAAAVSFFLGEKESAVVIVAVITLNAVLGTVQTVKASHSLNSLKALSAPNAKVLRDGVVVELPARELTVGDEVHLEAGDFVPADGRLMESASLKVDESALTGESLGVEKLTEGLSGELPLGDRKNMVYSGSFVTYGRGVFLVTHVGMETEVGKIAGLLKNTAEKKTPLQVNLDKFGQKLSVIILALCGLLFVLQVWKGARVADAFLFAVALAVAAIPEALSSIVTIVLAFGTAKMAKEGAIIRKLQAVEGLGSVSVVCSDKTGTLTQNKMTVEYYFADGRRIPAESVDSGNPLHKQMLRLSILCNDSTNVDGQEIGDPTETAMINLGDKAGVPAQRVRAAYPRLSELPFDSDRKRMSTLHNLKDGCTMITKGAPDVLLERSAYIQKNGSVMPMTLEEQGVVEKANEDFSREGLRVLGLAYKKLPAQKELALSDEAELVFLGLIAMMDPPREESAQAVADCISAGIRPIMITGDHKVTAASIAKRIGILTEDSQACEGAEIEKLSEQELEAFVEHISVYARVSPEHKIRIVQAWQKKGNIVAMTGDGVNDAPALKQADIGVAMGITGTEVSKDASSMVLTDDNFATIVKAVENGRNVYANIRRAIQFLLSGNFAGILVVVLASLLNLPVPFAAVQLLFINLLTDSLPAIALGLEPHKHEVMKEKPRPMNESILTKSFLRRIGVEGMVIGLVTLGAFLLGYRDGNARLASTMAFGVLCLSRLFHGYNCKGKAPVLFTARLFNNKYMQMAFLAGFVLLTAVLTIPSIHGMFAVQTLSLAQLLTVYGMAFGSMVIIQILKLFRKK